MKKSTKVWIGISTGVIIAATASTLLGIYIPQLISQKNTDELVKQQVKPSEGNGSYLKSVLKSAVGSNPSTFGDMKSFATSALNSVEGYKEVLNNSVTNYLIQFFKHFKGSDAFAERYKTWNEDINKQWDELVKSYKDKHGGSWEYYFQVNVLDPVGGNEIDWKRDKLVSNVDSAFNDFVFQNLYVSAIGKDGSPMNPTSSPTDVIKNYLYSEEFVNGNGGVGNLNKVKFQPNANAGQTTPYAIALANLQKFIFDDYVKETMPLVTSMTLYKHTAPQLNERSDYFNLQLAKEIANPTEQTEVVGTDASYKWQVFAPANNPQDSTSGEYTPNATRKYLDFVNNQNAFINAATGAIEIPVAYTDDSATLYYVKMNDVFTSSYTPYAAVANYKLNTTLGVTTARDPNVPEATFATAPVNDINGGTEIMGNFMSKSDTTPLGYFSLPSQITDIITDNTKYNFTSKYHGVKSIADTVDIKDSPFMITRNEAGVHIIGIDRYQQIKGATNYTGKINEIKNTILWRYILGEFGLSSNTGFTIDLKTQLKDYFVANRDRLIFEYMTTTNDVDADNIFSNNYTNVANITQWNVSIYKDYIQKWNEYTKYNAKALLKDTAKEKILGTQTSYKDTMYGNAVIGNGLAGILPYTRTATLNGNPSDPSGVVDKQYGYYKSVDVYEHDDTNDTFLQYTETKAQVKLTGIKTEVDTLVAALENQRMGMKALTYSSAKYNQYLQVGTSSSPLASSTEYANEGDVINNALSSWINLDNTKSIIEIEKLISDINYSKTADGAKKVLDTSTWALDGTYTNAYTPNVIPPVLPTDDITAKAYISYQLQQAFDINKKLPTMLENTYQKITADSGYVALLTEARKQWASTVLLNPTNASANLDYIRQIAALKYAFDYNETSDAYDFTKFRDYLLEQTNNNKKAAYAWVSNDRAEIIANYKNVDNGIQSHYEFKAKNMSKNAGAYGYAYQGATATGYKDNTTGMWDNDVTFNDNANYFNQVKLQKDSAKAFTGFTGMQFETNSSSDLPSTIRDDLFSNNLKVYKSGAITTKPNSADIAIKGALYSFGDRTNYVNYIKNQVVSWPQVNEITNWFIDSLGIEASISKSDITLAKSQLVAIAEDSAKLPGSVFTRNEQSLMVNSTYSTVQPDPSKVPYYYTGVSKDFTSTAIITQFNHSDVTKLFDTDINGKIDSGDKGLNWDVAKDGFLGSSAEAFFMSAFMWYSNQTSYTVVAYNNAIDRQEKVLVYDRRLNTSLGKTLISNYKENNTSE